MKLFHAIFISTDKRLEHLVVFISKGLPLACSKCPDASVDNVQLGAHELRGLSGYAVGRLVLFLSSFLCRICLGRRCLHNHVGFLTSSP